MASGEVIATAGRRFEDPHTGASIWQLTDFRAHSHHLYFTSSGLWDDGRRLLIGSHRAGAENLYSVELASGELTQLTDFPPEAHPALQGAFLNPVRNEVYLRNPPDVLAVDLASLAWRVVYTAPEGYRAGSLSCTADGQTICMALMQDLSERIRMDLGHGYIGFAEYSAARPHCQIVAIPTAGGAARVVYEEDFWLGHVNTSPILADVLTFCHEGPWRTIEQRMWMLRIASGEAQPLRKQVPGETVGHEYWFADGRRVGYHGSKDGVHRFGWIAWDGSKGREVDFPFGSTHFHSLDETLIVGDGGRDRPYVLLWRLRGDAYDGPRILLRHRGSFHVQILHVHPRMFRATDGTVRIVYTADANGYGNVFLADVGDLDALPAAE